MGFFPRRRKRASAGLVLLMVAPLVGYDVLRDEWQKRKAFDGAITRVYSERSFFSGRRNSFRHYWEIRGSDGEEHSVMLRPKSFWSDGRNGDWVVKRAGELYPELPGHR